MATIQRFEDILAWQRARLLTNDVYRVTAGGAAARDFALRDQIRRSALSVMLNISEGFARATDPDFCRFLSIAHGSVAEVQAALYISLDLTYINQEQFDRLYALANETSKLISGLQKYLTKPPNLSVRPSRPGWT
jgi:four helix bundle protein